MYIDLLKENIKIKVGDQEIKLYRIIAMQPFTIKVPNFQANMKYGTLPISWVEETIEKYSIGGYVQSIENLDKHSINWVGQNAKVFGNALLKNGAHVTDSAKVYGNSVIDNSYISDYALITGGIVGNSWLADYTQVQDTGTVIDSKLIQSAMVKNNGYVSKSFMFDGTYVIKNGHVENCIIKDISMVGGFAKVSNSTLSGRTTMIDGDKTNLNVNTEAKLDSIIPETMYGVI